MIKGLKEFVVKLDGIQDRLDSSQPLREACLLVETTAKQNCPVGNGDLRNSITSQVFDNVGVVGTNLHYAPYVEYGTGKFARDGDGRQTPWWYYDEEPHEQMRRDSNGNLVPTGKMTNFWYTEGQMPQPFLEPALINNEQMITRIFAMFVNGEAR